MTRKKVKLAYITNDAARKATFKKRKKGLLKKVTELSTLCGIEACAIIFSPFNSHPDFWPSVVGVQTVLSHFRSMPEMEQTKKMINQDSFLRHRIAKAANHLNKLHRENCEKEIAYLMFHSLTTSPAGSPMLSPDFSVIDLNDLRWLIDQKVGDVCKRIEFLRTTTTIVTADQPPYAPATEPWFMEMVNQPDDYQMGFNIGDDVIQIPNFGEENGAFCWSNNNNAFFFP